MFWKNRHEGEKPREFDIEKLPLPTTVQEVLRKNPEESPIKPEDFARVKAFFRTQKAYYQKLADENPDSSDMFIQRAERIPEIYRIVESQTRVITEKDFNSAVLKVKRSVEQALGQSPYLVFLHGKNPDEAKLHSTFYLANKLSLPAEKYITKADLSRPDVIDHLKNGGKVLIVDDAAYFGGNITEHLYDIQRVFPDFSPKNLVVSLVAITKMAYKTLKDNGLDSISAQYRIPQLDEILEYDDLRIARFMERKDDRGDLVQIPSESREVLTLLWQKVPDNFWGPLQKWKNKYWDGKKHHYWPGYLVDNTASGILPSYRGGKTFMNS